MVIKMNKYLIIFFLILLFFSTNVSALDWTSDLNTSLRGYYEFEETSGTTAYDSSANGADGTNSNATVNQSGKVGQSYAFVIASSSYVNSVVNTSRPTEATMSAWFYPTSSSGTQEIFSSKREGGSGGWNLQEMRLSSGELIWVNSSSSVHHVFPSGVSPTLNNWHFVAVTIKDNDYVDIYIDGTNEIHTAMSYATQNSMYNFVIGATYNVGYNTFFAGSIDEVGFWNRKLTTTELNLIYNEGAGLAFNSIDINNPSKITWNVYETGKSTHLTDVNIDCNINYLDAILQDSPFTSDYVDGNTSISCQFSDVNYLDEIVETVVDSNKTVTVYLDPEPVYSPCGTGGTVTDDGFGNRTHTFTSGGTFTALKDCDDLNVLVVAGGGGGGGTIAGGGGAGGLLFETAHSVTTGDYTVTVGAGGSGGVGWNNQPSTGTQGSNSIFNDMTATGGGGGGGNGTPTTGGSGGGGGFVSTTGASGTVGQGYDGGDAGSDFAGGGGGASEVGADGVTSAGGDGGDGLAYDISGTSTYYAGGGGAGTRESAGGVAGSGGLGGGGAGTTSGGGATSGTANTGGGGGGNGYDGSQSNAVKGGNGGSGIVIIKYEIDVEESADECAPTINEDWVVTSAIDCNSYAINLGTGNLVLSTGAKLRLFDSNISVNRFDINASGSQLWLGLQSWLKIS